MKRGELVAEHKPRGPHGRRVWMRGEVIGWIRAREAPGSKWTDPRIVEALLKDPKAPKGYRIVGRKMEGADGPDALEMIAAAVRG